ncbi:MULTISPECIES: DEAD/DEAH box helicase [Paenibacillus]|uniref:DEAD/DEAH box helicase n=1 Tax=Paenibacillus campinasensis TaxID=66347 RepID=A0A268EXX2_9BACL|nr:MULTISPECIES: DEAD/DEAH box helicase [Paenibacillus]PAD77980.1 DEAD/DEAH box helicase [Paenibacillus campinasensis]PAK52940.1 DEAD/DEAH box helicase [Paenibacillus sp. 7541]
MNATNFHTLGIAQDFTERLAEFGIESPSPVQSEAIPHILEGRDVLATSQTGTGKTLAYLLPVLQTIDPEVKGTQKVILAPTQELALQIVREAERYGEPRGIGVLGLIGGAAVKRQIEKLKQHPELVIGTPGRIRELIEVRKLKMHLVKTIVIDEVDQVFQLGAGGDVDRILKSALRDRQLVFLSATVSQQTADLVKQEMDRPVEVGIDPDMKTPSSLEHYYFVSEERDKLDMLRRVVRHYNPERAIVFVNNTDDLGEVEAKLNYLGLNAAAIYGDADKLTRSRVLNAFREGRTRLLVASDVAARGLDIEGLGMVINFDPPLDAEHYTHRAGRTGRMGRSGMVISLITDRQTFIMRKFNRELGITIEERAFYAGKVRAPRTASGSPQRSGGSGSGSGKARQARKPAAVSGKGRASTGKATAERQSERERTRKNKGAPRWLKDKSRE